MVKDRGGDGLGQEVVVGGFGVLQGQDVADTGRGAEGDGVPAGLAVGAEEVRAVAQRVGDALGVVVGVDQRALVEVDEVGGREL
ncbi:hypothetical protein [Streptomyces anulatus]|uniref:hypothetical protein n=1 Tax=Streptomyces anulatus TaxID=1892 RepID=UPI0004C51FA7|nr:hypothetical protein [Streptomyces anulatus]